MNKWNEFEEYLNNLRERGTIPFYLVESGSKLYGFSDKDSDIDVRGVVVDDIDKKLTLGSETETLDGDIGEFDYELHELEKFMGLMFDGNFNILEWVFSEFEFDALDVSTWKNKKELKNLATKCVSNKTGNHVRGWSKSAYNTDWNNPKKCLYAIRPMMTYIHFCNTGEFESNISQLALTDDFRNMQPHINKLISLKKRGEEVSEETKQKNKEYYEELRKESKIVEEKLEEYNRKTLKEEINNFMLEIRKRVEDEWK